MENDQPKGDTPEVIADSQAPVATEAAPEQQGGGGAGQRKPQREGSF